MLRGFWLDVKLFVIVEIVVLVARAGVALVPDVGRAPALFPLRLLGGDLRRRASAAIPTILVVYLVGFGVPGARAVRACRPTRSCSAASRSRSPTRAYVAEVYRAGHRLGAPQPAGGRARGRADRPARRCATSILPQAVRRVVPPLLNDFISLQKDVALVSILGPLEAFRVAQIEASSNFNYTPLVAAARCSTCA